MSSRMALPVFIPPSYEWELLLLHILTSIWCYQYSGFCYFNSCTVVAHSFNLHFHDNIWYGTSFHMLTCYLCIFFGKESVKVYESSIKIRLFASYCWGLRVVCIFWVSVGFCKYFLPVCSLCFCSLENIFHRTNLLVVMKFKWSRSVVSDSLRPHGL